MRRRGWNNEGFGLDIPPALFHLANVMLEPSQLPAQVTLLEQLDLPAWIFDLSIGRFLWCNARAVELWNAKSREELCQRDLSDMSEATRARLQAYLDGNTEGRGHEARDTWTYYPNGVPTTVQSQGFAITLPDARRVLLFCAFYKVEQPDASHLRSRETAMHTQVMLSLVDESGGVVFHNPAATHAFGGNPNAISWFEDEPAARALVARTKAEGSAEAEVVALTADGPRWHAVSLRKTRDPVTGAMVLMFEQMDVTRRREAERLVTEQRRRIELLSAPLLEVATHVLSVPLIGHLDEMLIEALQERLLSTVTERSIAAVIIDLTGLRGFDEKGLAALLGVVRALGLLGARAIVTGIPAELARTLAPMAESMANVKILRTLREGIAAASRI